MKNKEKYITEEDIDRAKRIRKLRKIERKLAKEDADLHR